jgi:hypothetical protein
VWVCPVCSSKVQQRRALEIGKAVLAWEKRGGSVYLATFTMRHNRSQELGTLWDALAYAWRMVRQGKAWLSDKRAHGVAGFCRIVEVTYSARFGWHVHVHALVFTEGPIDAPALQRSMFGRWKSALLREGLAAPLLRGQDIRPVTSGEAVAEYLTKTDNARRIALEMTGSQSKVARGVLGTRTTWDLLSGAVEKDSNSRRLWHEWEAGSSGRRQLAWTPALRRELLTADELSDEEIAAEEMGSAADALVTFDGDAWAEIIRHPDHCPALLDAAEKGGRSAVVEYCEAHGIPLARSLELERRLTELSENLSERNPE